MASPFVPVPVPMDRALSGGRLRRPQRAASLGSVSSGSESSSPITKSVGDERSRTGGESESQRQSLCADRAIRSLTPPPPQSPVTRARVNGTVEASVQYSTCPRSMSDPAGRQQAEERPITPTVLGYEVMEERAKFTVYKLLVRKSQDENWVVFRRYTDFSRLNDKLKEMFPSFRLSLPPKRWFKDNYDSDFLEDRQLGLQAFLQNLVAHKDIANCLPVREFLCLDDPPGPFDSLEESRAFCETLEESNYRLQKELLEKQKEIDSLKRKLEEKEQTILTLEKHANGGSLGSPCGLSTQGSESSADADMESSAAEADQDTPGDTGQGGVCVLQARACLSNKYEPRTTGRQRAGLLPLTVSMKLAVQCLCFLHFALLSFGLDTYISLSRSKASHSDGHVNQDRVRTLFARRALYEQQKIHESKKSGVVPHPLPPNDIPRPKAGAPRPPVTSRCSLLGQSCVPLCGCCDPCATCHCRFFNAICFCRRAERARSRCGSERAAKRRKARKKKPKTQP